jgi:hypothetical protein
MTQYRFTSAAHTELTQATLYYEQRENGLGTAFLDEVEATVIEYFSIPLRGISCRPERVAAELVDFPLV